MSNNLPSTKRFYSEDYKDAPPWFSRFIGQLNLFTEPMFNILNASVDVTANTNEEIYILQVNNASGNGASNVFLFTPKKFIGQPNGVLVGQCLLNSTTGIPMNVGNPVTIDWVWTGTQVKILAIYNLQNAQNYTLSLRIY